MNSMKDIPWIIQVSLTAENSLLVGLAVGDDGKVYEILFDEHANPYLNPKPLEWKS